MARLARFTQKIFGSNAGLNQHSQFGSLAAGSPATYSGANITPSIIQSLSSYLTGWFGAVMGGNSPSIEDMNALFYLYAYQLAYLFQQGVPEWDASTTYYIGNIVNSGGTLYISLVDNNLNYAVTNAAFWIPKGLQNLKFTSNGTFTAPAGVQNINTLATSKRRGLSNNSMHFLDPLGNAMYFGGNGNFAQAGNGTNGVSYSSPIAVVGGLQFQKIYGNMSGGVFGLTSSGQLYAWGNNTYATLGVGDTATRSTPTLVVGGLSFAKFIGNGSSSYGITTGGRMYAWGYNVGSGLGIGSTGVQITSPTALFGFNQFNRAASDLNGANTFALTSGGTLYSWGFNSLNGELGVGDTFGRSSPVAVLGGLTVTSVEVGYSTAAFGVFVAALDPSGNAYMWGCNDLGELGVGDVLPRSSPVAVLGGLKFSSIFPSNAGSMFALDKNGNAYAWGTNNQGNLGVGDLIPRSSPVLVVGGLQFAKLIVTKQQGTAPTVFGLMADGTLYAWGSNDRGQIGNGTTNQYSSPVLVSASLKFKEVVSIMYVSPEPSIYACTADGTIYAWGDNDLGQLGVGDTVSRSTPTMVLGGNIAMLNDVVKTTTISVTPGSSYPLNLLQYNAALGLNNVGADVDSLTIQFEN